MGVYYTNHLLHTPTIEVCLAKIYGDKDPIHATTLDALKSNPVITRIALSPVKEQYRMDFLSTIAMLKSTLQTPKCDELLDLFLGIGSEVDLSYKNTGVGFVNRIIKRMNLTSKFTKSNAASLYYESHEESDDFFKNDIVIAYMKAFKSQVPVGEGNFLLCSYLMPNDVFDLPQEVELTPRDPNTIKVQVNNYMKQYQQLISSLTDTFIVKMTNNSIYNYEFVKTVISSFKSVQDEQRRAKKLLEAAMEQLLGSTKAIPTMMKAKELSWDYIMEVSNKCTNARDTLNMLLNKQNDTQEIDKPALSYDIHVKVDNKPSALQLFLDSLSKFIRKTNESLHYSDREIHWGELVTDLNMILVQAGMETLEVPKLEPVDALVTFDPSSEINLELISGRHITITTQKGEEKSLDQLTAEELHNLNCILDVMTGTSNRFDHIRAYITKLLANK